MKRIILFFLALLSFSTAQESAYFLGLRSSKYALVGIESKYHFGMAVENSLFVTDEHLQYARIALFYNFSLPFSLKGGYAIYGGSRYNQDFYDYGARLQLKWEPIRRLFQMEGVFQPFYDSDLETKYAYKLCAQSIFFDDVGIYGGIKNLPDFRDTEIRYFGGVAFDLPKLKLYPEISRPINGSFYTTRITVNFIYKSSI